jgi:hypothetical protein
MREVKPCMSIQRIFDVEDAETKNMIYFRTVGIVAIIGFYQEQK